MGFQGTDGFCVYDAAGRLAFRVDNYSRRRKLCAGELLLMDGQGTPLLSLRPQVYKVTYTTLIYLLTSCLLSRTQMIVYNYSLNLLPCLLDERKQFYFILLFAHPTQYTYVHCWLQIFFLHTSDQFLGSHAKDTSEM